jgi:phospholipid/cholesterol/gamma-HCH transport system substrate-binding protein
MERKNKVVVGMFVGGCLLLFAVGLFLIGNSNQLFTKSFVIVAEFKKVTGVQKGGKVRVAGMDAGTVTRIEVPPTPEGKFRIHFRIIEKLHSLVRTDSVATIQTDGLLGNKYLDISAGTSSSELARSNSTIQSAEPFDWGDLMEEISSTVKHVNGILVGVKDQLASTMVQIEATVKSVDGLIKDARPEVRSILASAKRITANVHQIIDGVQAGEGTVGALFKDDEMKDSVKRSVRKTENVIEDVREATASIKKVTAKVEDSDIVPEVQKTLKNLQEITLHVKDAVDKFQAASGEGGVGENLQRTLADAHEAMSDLSDNTEALKHNFFFRGFFKKRGFFELGALTTPEYQSPKFGKGFQQLRLWHESEALFTQDAKGVEVLTAKGKAQLDESMTAILQFPRNGPLMIEGFAGTGTASQQYLQARRRAVRVQSYLIDRFHLRPAYTGVVAFGAESIDTKTPGLIKEGVGIVSFYK